MKLLMMQIVILILVGCAAQNRVVAKIGDTQAQVRVEHGDLGPGDRVTLYRKKCIQRFTGTKPVIQSDCTKEKIGEGRVAEALSDRDFVINLDPGVAFQKGDIVERQK